MQTKREILIETTVNVTIGVIGAYVITLVIFGLGTKYGWSTALTSGLNVAACTAWSFFRSYHVRFHFNQKLAKRMEKDKS